MKNVRSRFERTYWWMRRRLIPAFQGSQAIYERALRDLLSADRSWLDIGCGHQILPEWRAEVEPQLISPGALIVGLDYDLPSLQRHKSIPLRVRGDIGRLPFGDSSFDLVTANMVIEHLDNPAIQFAEISRVLKPGGHFLFITPNARGYFSQMRRLVPDAFANKLATLLEGRASADVFPVHYRANTTSSIGALAHAAGLEVTSVKMVVTDAVFQMVPPLALVELLWMRILLTEPLKEFRTNIIGLLGKSRQ